MRNLIILFLSTFMIAQGTAQEQVTETSSFTLNEAIAFALENNYSAINADRDVIDAQKQKWEVIADGLPQISGAISYQNQLKQPVSLIPAEFAGGEPGEFVPIVFGQAQNANATATLRQKIFDGSYIVGVQATKSFLRYISNNKEKNDLEVRRATTEAYGNVLLAQESVGIFEKNKEALEKNLFETQKLFENGLGDEESVEQLQITLSSVDNQLKNAIRLEGITLQMLNLVMGIAIDAPTKLSENLDDLAQKQVDLALLESDFNIENNIDYKLALNLNEQRYFEHKLAKSRALPTLNAFLNYGTSAFADDFNFLSSDQQWFDSSILGFDLSIPIFSSFKRRATEEQIRLQLESSKSQYILAIEQYDTAKNNLDLAERIENKNQIKYTEGLASSFELRQAQTQLYDAQQGYLQSMVEVINKKTELETILNNKS